MLTSYCHVGIAGAAAQSDGPEAQLLIEGAERLGLADLPKARYTEDAALGMQVRPWA